MGRSGGQRHRHPTATCPRRCRSSRRPYPYLGFAVLLSCTMLITEPNRFVAEVHDRMPVILKPEQFDAWLYGSMAVDEIKTPIDDDSLRRRRVARP